ncbi:unnamed protein product [Rotaria magnacalcarata]|uniref:NAD(P)(+)--arginine ADP-ribosyltransferase n=2 Tax=Rotaria magnacalcarata TaxID=392030 RepID=A0A8S2SJB0_9BILA|nr:unnamed protein product [Rotaria magnacalcarata]
MIFECRRNYPGCRSELNQIEEFGRSYCSNDAINWYTRDFFLYRTINRALRTEDILVLYTYRFFIIDMCKRLEELKESMTIRYPSSFHVYRGSKLSREEVEQLRAGDLVATNGFFSCSRSLEIAQAFIGIDPITGISPSEGREDRQQYAIFEININLTETPDIVVADVSDESVAPQENEILFSLGTTFAVQQVTYDDEHHVWHIELILSTEVNHINQQYKKFIRDKLQEYDATMFFGNCLGDILGDYHGAMRFFYRQLRIKPIDDECRPNTLYHLARIYRCIGLYSQAINYFRRAMLLQRRRLPQSGYDYAQTISGLAMLYSETGHTKQSLDLQTKAVNIYRTYLPEHHEAMAIVYNRLAYVCYQEQQYERAESLLSVALSVLKDKGPMNYTGYATSLDLMGTVKWTMGVKDEAVVYLTEALKMRESFLTEDHPLVARTCYTLAKLHAEMEKDHSTAMSYALRALRIREAKLTKNHRELILSSELVQQLTQKNII